MKIVITGANSFLGTRIVEHLASNPQIELTAIASHRFTGDTNTSNNVRWFSADLCRELPAQVKENFSAADKIIHFAWSRCADANPDSNQNNEMIRRILDVVRDPSRFYFISSVTESPRALSIYGRTKYQSSSLVRKCGGSVLICGLVIDPISHLGSYGILHNLVRKLPVRLRVKETCQPMVYPVYLKQIMDTIMLVSETGLSPGSYSMFGGPVGLNTFISIIENHYPGKRIPVKISTSLVLRMAGLMKSLKLHPAGITDKILSFFYKDTEYLANQENIPGARFHSNFSLRDLEI